MQPESSQAVWGSVAIGPGDDVFSRPASSSGIHLIVGRTRQRKVWEAILEGGVGFDASSAASLNVFLRGLNWN